MNDSKKMAIIIAVVFFLAGTVLNIDYAMWNEETYKEYQESEPYICWSLHSDTNNCPEDMRMQIEYNDWKFYNGKSYWKDLAKRLSVLEVSADDTNTTESNQLEHSKIIRVETNASGWDCWFYPEEDRTWCVYTCYCGCGDSNCEGDPEYNEGCTPEEPKLTGLTGKWEMVDEYSTELNVSIGEVNISDWSEVDESIFEMYPIHNPPTIYVMQVSSGWDYRTFKLPIYRRI